MQLLQKIESIGNKLPHPATLFFCGFIIVVLCSELAVLLDWKVINPISGEVEAKSLLRSDGIWWFLSHLVQNFIQFPPLGIVLVGMLGIGMAERSGLLPALLSSSIQKVPMTLLTPATIFIGIISSVALDAGYVVLPPLVAALYLSLGRSPVAGIAATFAGVSAGFSANLIITALDPLLAGFTESAAQIISPEYQVTDTANLWFMIASTIVLTVTGWIISVYWVEPQIGTMGMDSSVKTETLSQTSEQQSKGLYVAGLSFIICLAIILAMIFIENAPLHGEGKRFARWVEATVPILFILFFIPGICYGFASQSIKNDKDIANIMSDTMSFLASYIVLAFFAAQFIESFKYSGLGEMLAITGGNALTQLAIPSTILMILFVLMAMLANLLMGSASAKYAFLAPVFVPMFMQVGISPELTQAAYRIGDSTTNVITPLNPYMIIVLALFQKYVKGSGLGTLVAVMLPYTIGFAIVWITLLSVWMLLGLPLGPGGNLYL